MDDGGGGNKKTIYFNSSKKESHHPNNGFKKWFRRLKTVAKCSSIKDELTTDRLSEADLVIFGGPRDLFSVAEFKEIKEWLNNGGRALILLGDGGEKATGCNLNYLLEEYGMSVNSDSVTRSVYYKYLHPKEVFIAEGVLVPDIARKKNTVQLGTNSKNKGGATANGSSVNNTTRGSKQDKDIPKFAFVYPYGASLNVQRPSIPILSSGPISYPMNRPLASIWEAETVTRNRRGRMVVMGSVEIFGDDWLDKEDNGKLADILVSWLLDELELDVNRDRNDKEIADNAPVPNIESISAVLKPCLQGLDELPRDFTRLFDMEMFGFDFKLVPEAVNLYKTLSVPHETLSLIPPNFECPLPKLQIAVFPPAMREPPPPALDQFDLDEHFAKEGIRLAQLTNKCSPGEEDLEYFVAEAGEILGVVQHLAYGERSAKHILFHIFKQIVDCKKQEFDASMTGGAVPASAAYGSNNTGMTSPRGDGDGQDYYYHHGDDSNTRLLTNGADGGYAAEGRVEGMSGTSALAHHGHVDLAPMKLSVTARSNLLELDPKLQLGGRALGNALGGGNHK
jgi:intraflagellar transport protein 52